MTDREKLIEAMARAMHDARPPRDVEGKLLDFDDPANCTSMNCTHDATAALAAIEARIAELTRERDEARAGLRALLSYTEQLELLVYSSEQNETVHPTVQAARTALEGKP
jgi:hypothetical protein